MDEWIQLLKGITEKGRLRLLALIVNNGEMNVQQATFALQLPFAMVSRNLRTLEIAGWLRSRRQGRWIFYRCKTLNPTIIKLRDYILDSLNEEEIFITDTQRFLNFQSNSTSAAKINEKSIEMNHVKEETPLPPLPPFNKK